MNIFAEHAWRYWKENLPVIPLAGKRPLLRSWTVFAERLPTPDEQLQWRERYPNNNIGLPLGPMSGLCAIDIDTNDPEEVAAIIGALPTTPYTRIGKKGCVLLFRWSGEKNFKVRFADGRQPVELLGKGNQVVLPPSIHPETGRAYTSNQDLWKPEVLTRIPPLPDGFSQHTLEAALGINTNANRKKSKSPATKGGRHNALASELGRLVNQGIRGEALHAAAVAYDTATLTPSLRLSDPLEFADLVKAADENWEGSPAFCRNDKNRILPLSSNLALALDALGVKVSFDEFNGRQCVEGLEQFGPSLCDDATNRLRLEIAERFGFLATKEWFSDALRDLALKASFHPVCDYLAEAQARWDGKKRLTTWLSVFGGAADTPYVRAAGAITLIAAVRRVRQPGTKFDTMLVLEGVQGCGKSSALEILATRSEWFTDHLPFNATNRELIESLSGHWIVEAGELMGLNRADATKVKALLSRHTDSARAAYGKIPTSAKRQCVFIGSTNSAAYLNDSTGNRRFLPVRVEKFDLKALAAECGQLWGEAAALEATGASLTLPSDLWAVAAEEQEARRSESPIYSVLASKLQGRTGRISTTAVWDLLAVPTAQRHGLSKLVGEAMAELGWERVKLRFGNTNPESGYARGTELERVERLVAWSGSAEAMPVQLQDTNREEAA